MNAEYPNTGFVVAEAHVCSNNGNGRQAEESFLGILKEGTYDAVGIDTSSIKLTPEETERIIAVKLKGVPVYDLAYLFGVCFGMVPLSAIDERWLLSREGTYASSKKTYLQVKRVFDLVLAALVLLLTGPLLVLIAFLVKATSKGPVFFSQVRLGLNRKPFRCHKFRTMVDDAENGTGPVWSSENDSRLTTVGKWLIKTRLDELPQLWNILKGEMSFVGPRPIREYFAKQMSTDVPFYWLRFEVKPGVTGWAQVKGCFAVPDGYEAFQYELVYLQSMSFVFDLFLIFKRFQTMCSGKGK
jgi:lipopolysaccharide/colanic/teichoic acid biosynthesis glycosyltransferase